MEIIKKLLLAMLVAILNIIIISNNVFATTQNSTDTEEITIKNNQVVEWTIAGKENKFMRFSYYVKTKSQIEKYKISLSTINNSFIRYDLTAVE